MNGRRERVCLVICGTHCDIRDDMKESATYHLPSTVPTQLKQPTRVGFDI